MRVHGEMCVHPDLVLAIMMENWEDRPRPNATQELQKLNIGRTIPIQRGFHDSPKIAMMETPPVVPPPIDQDTKQAVATQDEGTTECTGDTSLDNDRKDMENTDELTEDGATVDEPTEDDATATSARSEESVTAIDSKPKAPAPQYLVMDTGQHIALSESPADYVIYLYNIFFLA
jgi:hypothetical protein